MRSLLLNKKDIIAVSTLGVLLAALIMVFAPMITANMLFIIAIPFIAALFLLMVINPKAMLVVLLFIRALLDPILDITRVNIFGQEIGAGGAINLFVLILACIIIFNKVRYILKESTLKAWIIFLFLCAVSIAYTPDSGRAIRFFFNLASYAAMLAMAFSVVNSTKDKKFWLKVIMLSSIPPIIFANIDLVRRGTYFVDAGMRIVGSFTHPNILAFYLVLILTVSFYIFKTGLFSLTRAKRNILMLYMANLVILILATKTRSAWVSCWALFFIYGLLKERKYLVGCAVFSFLALLHPAVRNRAADLLHLSDLDKEVTDLNSLSWRFQLWKSSLAWIKDRPIFGHGLTSFRYSFLLTFDPFRWL
jgi:O-antigen ligase